jgi:hypothetical protein
MMDKFYAAGCHQAKLAFGIDTRVGMEPGEAYQEPVVNTEQHDEPKPQGYPPTHASATPRHDSLGSSNWAFDRLDSVAIPEHRGRSTPTTEYIG